MNSQINEIKEIKAKYRNKTIGFTCGCFDLLHYGHLLMLKDAKDNFDILVIGLQTDPTIDRPNKNRPIQSLEERLFMLQSLKYIDEIVIYTTEDDLYNLLQNLNPDCRILGTDYLNKSFTGDDLNIPIFWHNRNHTYSSTDLRKRVYIGEKSKIVD
jgi:glycerol-3-phosphate cytidylyltransferase